MDSHRIAWSTRGYLIYLLALPLLPALLTVIERGEVMRIALTSVALTLFVLAALSVRFGTRRQRRRAISRYARANTHWLTWIGCLSVAAGCFVCQHVLAGNGLATAGMMSLAGFAGAFLSYGSMWRRASTTAGLGYSAEEIAQELRQAEEKVQAIKAVARQLPHGETRRRLKRIASKTYRVLYAIERDPADLRRARKFLNVFLPGTRKVAESYVRTERHGSDKDFDLRFVELLKKTEEIVDEQHGKLRDKHIFDLDVQMEVLQTQLDAEARR